MRRTFLFLFFLLTAAASKSESAVTAANDTAQTADAAHTARSRPNIVFILTDDQRFDSLGCAGNRIIQTPHLDRLAASGVRFSNHFVTTSICCVSRASIFTGAIPATPWRW
jgi:arylsulfatase A-like enzyme